MKQPIPTLYLKGTFNGWGPDTPFIRLSDTLYTTSVIFSADRHQFKVADMGGSEDWTFSAHPTDAVSVSTDTPVSLKRTQNIGNDLVFSPAETGLFTLNLELGSEEPTLTIVYGSENGDTGRSPVSALLPAPEGKAQPLSSTDFAPAPEALFEMLAIESRESFPYVFGDNTDGYFEGTTFTMASGGRYRHHQGWYLGGFASFTDDRLNDKTRAEKARLLPYGAEHIFNNGAADTLTLLSGQRTVCLTVQSENAATLALLPELNIPLARSRAEQHDGVFLYEISAAACPQGCPRYIAISADQQVTAEEGQTGQWPEAEQALALPAHNTRLMLSTSEKATSLTIYLCFEHDKQAAIDNARNAAFNRAEKRHQQEVYDFLTTGYLQTENNEYNRALMWSRLASRTFVSHEFGTGIWAGLPWFKDCWGRDTFIALPGTCLVNGRFAEARSIIENFATMQMADPESVNYGRIPNRVTSKTNIIYNTTDGTPWMIREIMEYINYSGDMDFARTMYPVVQRFIEGVEKHYLDNDGLMKHRHPDTWMDAKINGQIPWSPRGPKANDIQALWFESLQVASQLAELCEDPDNAQKWQAMAEKAKTSFSRKFWDQDAQILADRLEEGDEADFSIRPNQLMTLSIPQAAPLISDEQGPHIVRSCVDNLLFPWGICSLEQTHPDFHPYHDNRSEYHKDAAYHNGTIWGWNAGFTVSALTRYYQQDFAWQLSQNLGRQILEQGHRGTMSENLDAFQPDAGHLSETGTYAQAWSVSEYARNAQQDYLGFRPQLLSSRLVLAPRIPSGWGSFTGTLPFGNGNQLLVRRELHDNGSETFTITPVKADSTVTLDLSLMCGDRLVTAACDLSQPVAFTLDPEKGDCLCNREEMRIHITAPEAYPVLKGITFATPKWEQNFNALSCENYLLSKRNQEALPCDRD